MNNNPEVSNRLVPRAFGDLRGWIEALRIEGEIHEIEAEVDWNCELGTIARRAFGNGDGPALLFDNISGYGPGDDVWCRRVFTGGMSNYTRVAMTLGLPKDAPVRDMVQAVRYYLDQRVPPVEVETGKVKENIHQGDDIDLYKIPVPRWHREDGGRYINTYQATITMDPDTGVHNVGLYRGMLGEKKNTLPVLLWRAQHWGVHFEKWRQRGMKMPVAHVYGWEPSMSFCASAPVPTGVCEYEVMGAMRGEPVPLVKCETSDLWVPADAEMVIEGFIDDDPATFEMEGPFGEYTGYFGGDQGPKHVTQVTCVTHRDDPIHRGTLEGTMPKMLNENSVTSSVQRAGIAWNVLERAGVPGITDVHCPAANNGTSLMIQIHQTYRGQAKQAAAAIWGSNAAHLRYKNIWVVDEDIDIHDYGALDWALAYRVNAAEDDIVFFPSTFGSLLDPSTRLADRDPMLYGTGKWTRMLIDATVNMDFDPEEQYGGNRYPPMVIPHDEDWEKVDSRWEEYGFKRDK
ncbi:MAG: UbiD family decarboxylase [Rhodospirillales bacterium]|nr:UbiD family decarboxylase [Rhodospirillales bacterium]MDP6644769.1 UbiD family decarboxylase [Rhodospirillales bacterium]MDP6843375.1 UbiD family decarboxylase [Rhodospirillales bacterium]